MGNSVHVTRKSTSTKKPRPILRSVVFGKKEEKNYSADASASSVSFGATTLIVRMVETSG
jgi:hypothetical protein